MTIDAELKVIPDMGAARFLKPREAAYLPEKSEDGVQHFYLVAGDGGDGQKIAERGRPGTPQAGQWLPKPGYSVRDDDDRGGLTIVFPDHPGHPN